ncbi:MAG: hypothetical protein R6X20_03965 [Phycisphaerae bacterium]
MKTKPFDCVAMKRQRAVQVYNETKDMDDSERMAFWRRRTDALKKRQRARRRST